MPPNIRADFYLKQGVGQARFARFRRAEALMKEALAIAGAAGLHEVEFRIERILAGLGDCEQAMAREAQPAAEPALQSDELREVSESLAIPQPGENARSEEHTSELQSLAYLVCRLLL